MNLNERIIEMHKQEKGRRTISRELGVSERKVRSVLAEAGRVAKPYDQVRDTAELTSKVDTVISGNEKGSLELTGNTGWLSTGVLGEPVKDWNALLRLWNLDPDEFEVVEPVSFKAWDGHAKETKQLKDEQTGELKEVSSLVNKRLFAYKAKIQKKSIERRSFEENFDFAGWSERLKRPEPIDTGLDENASTYVILVADPQLGKPGTQETLENWKRGVEGHVTRIKKLSYVGHKIKRVVVAFMGDEHEGVCNNYVNQPYEVEMSFSAQLELDLEMRLWTIARVGDTGLPLTVVSVVSNHGEFTRNGTHLPVTDKYDNSSTLIAKFAKRVVEEQHGHGVTEWLIAERTQDIVTTLSGVKVSFSHGHIAKGRGNGSERRTISAIEKQILGRTEELGDVSIYFTAHYHHSYHIEERGRTIFGCPALEAEKSSEYFYDQYGVWSKPGMSGLLVGNFSGGRTWSEHQIY